ncbi:hypothetical protein ACRQ5Q_22300 [Bradyrhizobium sp. PMVTL-01]|uniref:hypothetical protein n=1 Tax=Bradyrhizobium sp. PMVTL-01 TaxID=3434999 RepID=UPI003F700B7D
MADPVSLCNLALGQIVARTQITGLDPPSPSSNVAATTMASLYQLQVDAVFRAAHWNCARKQAGLTLLKAAVGTPENPSGALPAPPIPWRYEYGYPNDCLKVRFVIPKPSLPANQAPLMTNVGVNFMPSVNSSMPFVPAVDVDEQGNQIRVILTNAPNVEAVYTARIANVDLWDPSLQNAVVGALGAWGCAPISGSLDRQKVQIAIAANLIKAARDSDGNEGITQMDIIPDWIQVRNTGSGLFGWNLPQGGYMASWDGWAGPDGVSY